MTVTVGAVPKARHRYTGPPSFWVCWLLSAVVLFVIGLIWSLSSPVPTGPDEPAELVKAAAVAHGSIIGHPTDAGPEWTWVRVPGTIAQTVLPAYGCTYYKSYEPGGCIPREFSSSRPVVAATYVGRYPPLYYFAAGLPSDVSSGVWILHGMRAVGALVGALTLALAFAAAWRWSRSPLMAVGLAIAVTPEAMYLNSVVNPNGFEVSAAISTWVTGAILVLGQEEDPPAGLVAAFGVSSGLLAASRNVSPFWMALIWLTLFALRPGRGRHLLNVARIRIAGGAALAVALLSGVYILVEKSYVIEKFPLHITTTALARKVLGATATWLKGTIGAYGAPDTYEPLLVMAIWVLAGAVLVLGAILLVGRRESLVLIALGAASLFVIPFVLTFAHARTAGISWQGRYGYPLAAGLPILAGAMLARTGPRPEFVTRRAFTTVTIATAVGHLVAWYWLLRRYTVGIGAAINPFQPVKDHWVPPLGIPVLLVGAILSSVAYAGLVRATGDRPERPPADVMT